MNAVLSPVAGIRSRGFAAPCPDGGGHGGVYSTSGWVRSEWGEPVSLHRRTGLADGRPVGYNPPMAKKPRPLTPDQEAQLEELEALASSIASGGDLLMINAGIWSETLDTICRALADAKAKRAAVFLTTLGGDPHIAYQIARVLQAHYKSWTVLVPSLCKSAGTLIASAANEIAMGERGELGPIDVQMPKHGEVAPVMASSSVLLDAMRLLSQQARDAFREQLLDMAERGLPTALAAPIAAQIVSGLFGPVMARIDPHHLGEVSRASDVTYEYLRRLGQTSGNVTEANARALVKTYPDHRFVIDLEEARERFKKVRPFSADEARFVALCTPLLTSVEHEGAFIQRISTSEPTHPKIKKRQTDVPASQHENEPGEANAVGDDTERSGEDAPSANTELDQSEGGSSESSGDEADSDANPASDDSSAGEE